MPDPSLSRASSQAAWVTIGTFDGVHLAHKAILEKLIKGAHASNCKAIVVTFNPHPAEALHNQSEPYYLCTLQEREALIKEMGVDQILTLKFDQQFANQSAKNFIDKLSKEFEIAHMLVGHDFRFGINREGDFSTLRSLGKKYAFSVENFPPQTINGLVISSSEIRQLITKGEVRKASELLGRWYAMSGEVIHGDGRGKHIGIPTANIEVWSKQLLPLNGVYACMVELDSKSFPGVVNIGNRPTFYQPPAKQTIETHILDFNKEIYGKIMKVSFIERLRPELRYSSAEELISQIQNDIQETRKVLMHAAQTQGLST